MSNPSRKLPPHMQRILEERSRGIEESRGSSESARASLERRRLAIQFDIDQGELAQQPDNPWSHRISLLTEAIANVEAELADARKVTPGTYAELPAIPVENVVVSSEEPYDVRFAIADQDFRWQEKLDWIERGGLLAQPEMEHVTGDARLLLPADTPDPIRGELAQHLVNSVTAFAVALRDARLNGEPVPVNVTLADLARPCPECGGWTDYYGHCNTCAHRRATEQHLFQERQRLMKERSAEAEERHRMSERLPLARRRMADLEREIQGL